MTDPISWQGCPESKRVKWRAKYASIRELALAKSRAEVEALERATELADLGYYQVSRKYRRVVVVPTIDGSAMRYLEEAHAGVASEIRAKHERAAEAEARQYLHHFDAPQTAIDLDLRTFETFRAIKQERGQLP